MTEPLVGVVMGSASDWDTMQHCASTLDQLGIPYEKRALSDAKTKKALDDYRAAQTKKVAEAKLP